LERCWYLVSGGASLTKENVKFSAPPIQYQNFTIQDNSYALNDLYYHINLYGQNYVSHNELLIYKHNLLMTSKYMTQIVQLKHTFSEMMIRKTYLLLCTNEKKHIYKDETTILN
jgi:hypothetical protein